MEKEQKRLYEHFKKLSVDGVDTKQRTECKRYAKEILKSFPHFEKKENPKSDKAKGAK